MLLLRRRKPCRCHCNVANDNMLLMHVTATLLLFITINNATPTPATKTATRISKTPTATTTANATTISNITATAATKTTASAAAAAAAAAALDDGEVIGATSLAAAAGAAAAIAATGGLSSSMTRNSKVSPSTSTSSSISTSSTNINSNNNEMIGNSANLLLENFQHAGTGQHVVNLTRNHDGDVFHTNGVSSCNIDTCVGLSSGTAALVHLGGDTNDASGHASAVGSLAGGSNGQLELLTRRTKTKKIGSVDSAGGENCQCRCLSYLSTYREDLGICVDDIHECSLSPFVSGSSSEKIPFVFLPLRGQIIYPSREISFPHIRTPVCAVTGAQYLTTNGWSELRNPIDTDYPFRMFRDEGRTFLQWLGEPDLRHKMQGRLIVVHLVCRDMTLTLNATKKEQMMPPKNVFSPCVAFRVNGTPVKYAHNVSEVLFQSEATTTLASTSDGMTTKEYVVIGICSLLLGLIYVSSVFLYLHMKKRKSRDQSHMRNSLDDLANEINYPRNDQVTFGAPFNRSGSIYSATSLTTSNEPRSRASIGSLKEEMGIVKNNPLLQQFPQLGEHLSGFASDISNSNSECEMDGGGGYHDKLKQMQTAALVHPQLGMGSNSTGSPNSSPNRNSNGNTNNEDANEISSSPTQESECLPVENVSIVEDMMTEEKMEHLRAMVNGNVRKKLYFNPAYFEPHLLAQPPPAAVEFLQKIREVIAIAKYKMATKRYQPSLIVIPEEGQPLRSNTPSSSLYGAPLQAPTNECNGCAGNRCSGHIKNCGDKRNSIEKWLQTVSSTDQQKCAENQASGSQQTSVNAHENVQCGISNMHTQKPSKQEANSMRQQSPPQSSQKDTARDCGSSKNSPRKELTPPKQRPPPPPTPTGCSSSRNAPTNTSRAAQHSGHSNVIEISQNQPQHGFSSSAPANASHYQHYCATNIVTGPGSSITIPVNRNYEAFTALSAAANMYGFAETGSEIYNNPKFILHDSPAASQRSHSSSHRSKSSRKRLDVLDQYAAASTPTSLSSAERQHYEMLRNMKQMPNMVYDAITRDYNCSLMTNGSFQLDIPTPDYDSTIEKKIKDIYNNTQSSAPSVPTPDYSTLSRKSLKQYQPDSPVYRRKSPQYLIVDYETDSLERLEATKRKSSQSSSSPSSDVSSQLSPSLSTALPLEEELEISHTVYNKIDGFRKDGNAKKKVITKVENNATKQKEIATRIKYDTPFRGSMTIEVEHEPQSDLERSTDSDQYEPDTLDRKPKKQSFCDVTAWSGGQLKNSYGYGNGTEQQYNRMNNMNCMDAMPDMSMQTVSMPTVHTNGGSGEQSSFVLKSSNSFRNPAICNSPSYASHVEMRVQPTTVRANNQEIRPSFDSLRELYQSPLIRQNSQQSCKCGGQANLITQNYEALSEQGRLLTLEAKQKRRQQIIQTPVPPPVIEISTSKGTPNKTTIKISTPKANRATSTTTKCQTEAAIVMPQVHNGICASPANFSNHTTSPNPSQSSRRDKGFYNLTKNLTPASTLNSTISKTTSSVQLKRPARSPPPLPPPPPPPTSASTTLTSQRSHASSSHQSSFMHPHYQNQTQYMHHSTTNTNTNTTTTTEEETASNHSESTEITGVSDNMGNSEFDGGSCNNTLSSVANDADNKKVADCSSEQFESGCSSTVGNKLQSAKMLESPQMIKKLHENQRSDYGAMFNTQINGLRNDYSLTKYLNRRKSQDAHDEGEQSSCNDTDSQLETNNNINAARNSEIDQNKLDVLSISSRSNRSSSRLSDRTKEMYRNSGVPVGIAYPQRSTAASNTNSNSVTTATSTSNVQTVYRCEIEPVQLTHGMQIAMGLKDRAKKAKDLKNAWKKFVSMAAAKFSPTHSPAPPFDKKTPSFLEVLDRDEGISSLIDEHPQVSTPKSSYSAPACQNYYEQRFGGTRPQEMDSGYMSADSGEVYKRNFYDRYNFKMMSGRDHIIRVDTIEDNSDGGGGGDSGSVSTLTNRHNGLAASVRRGNIVDSNRFEDLENIGEPPACELLCTSSNDDVGNISDADSDKTLTHSADERRENRRRAGTMNLYSSEEDDQANSASYGSSETDGETNAEDMWESGAESIETHSVLYKNVRKN